MDQSQQAARDAHRYLARRVRNDWAFPAVPAAAAAVSDEELHGVAEYRERAYGTTSASPSPEPSPAAAADTDDAYKFDSPDSVAADVQDAGERRALARRRKRRRVLEEEMQWNEGMLCFVRRRDAWTGATSVRKYARRRSRTSDEMPAEDLKAARKIEAILDETAGGGGGGATATQDAANGSSTATAHVSTADDPGTRHLCEIPFSEEPLVPLAAPLLANNAIRQSITPRVYPDIYSKIVVASQTPKVPINLSDMTRALVQGWKDDGEWPPKAAPLDPLMGSRRKDTGTTGTTTTATGPKRSSTGQSSRGSAHGQDFLAQHPHVKRGVDSVKRVFRLSSSGGGVAQEQGTPPIV